MKGKGCSAQVIIPNWNGLRFLEACLKSLRQQRHEATRVMVVDNASTDGSREFIGREFPDVRVLSLDRNYGFSEAVNRGILASDADYIGLLNNDTEADPGWVGSCVRALQDHPEIGYVACQVRDYFQRDRLDSAGDYLTKTGLPLKRGADQPVAGDYLNPRRVFGATAGAAFYRREMFQEVGLFDTGYFMYLEDVDWCMRAALMGHRCLYIPDARVYHVEGGSDPMRAAYLARGQTERKGFHTPERTYWITRNRVRLLARNYPAALLSKRLPWIAWGFARSAAFHGLRSGLFRQFARGWWCGLREIPQCLEARRRIQRGRRISTRQFEQILLGQVD